MEGWTIEDLKQHLQRECDVARFLQQLSHNGDVVKDDEEVRLVQYDLFVLGYVPQTAEQTAQLADAAQRGNQIAVKGLLHLPMHPDVRVVQGGIFFENTQGMAWEQLSVVSPGVAFSVQDFVGV